MKATQWIAPFGLNRWLVAGGMSLAMAFGARAADAAASTTAQSNVAVEEETAVTLKSGSPSKPVTIESIEEADEHKIGAHKPTPWLGVFTEEAPDALTSQLALEPGVGLVVAYVAPDSPAAKAGLKKNDLLVECSGQPLVHPAQLRKLVRVRNEGDAVQMVFYRAGKKQTASLTLASGPADLTAPDGTAPPHRAVQELRQQLRDLPVREAVREQMNAMRESLKGMQSEHKKLQQDVLKRVQEEVRKSVEQARKVAREALRSATNAGSALEPMRKTLEELAKSGMLLNNDATVTVRSGARNVKSIVRTDDSGTIVIVCNPKPHLTAHDQDGKLLFDGEIDTPAQRRKVPAELLDKAKPLLEKLNPHPDEESEAEPEK